MFDFQIEMTSCGRLGGLMAWWPDGLVACDRQNLRIVWLFILIFDTFDILWFGQKNQDDSQNGPFPHSKHIFKVPEFFLP